MTASSSVFFSSCVPSVFSGAWLPHAAGRFFLFLRRLHGISSSCVNFEPQYSHLYAPGSRVKISSPSQFGHLKLITDMQCSSSFWSLFSTIAAEIFRYLLLHIRRSSLLPVRFSAVSTEFSGIYCSTLTGPVCLYCRCRSRFSTVTAEFPVFVVPHSQVHSLPAGAAACVPELPVEPVCLLHACCSACHLCSIIHLLVLLHTCSHLI